MVDVCRQLSSPGFQNTQFLPSSNFLHNTRSPCQNHQPNEPAEQIARGTGPIHARGILARQTQSRIATDGHVATAASRTDLVLATDRGHGTATIEGATEVDPGIVGETGSGMHAVCGIEIGVAVGIDMVVGEVGTEHFVRVASRAYCHGQGQADPIDGIVRARRLVMGFASARDRPLEAPDTIPEIVHGTGSDRGPTTVYRTGKRPKYETRKKIRMLLWAT